MLVIRKEQMKAFADARYRAFAVEACRHCRLRHPEICSLWSEDKLRRIVDNGLLRARSHGFETAADLIRFLDLAVTEGVDFDESSWAGPILAEKQYGPKARLDALFRALGARGAQAAAPPPTPALRDVSWPDPEPQPAPPPAAPGFPDAQNPPPPPARKWGLADHATMSRE